MIRPDKPDTLAVDGDIIAYRIAAVCEGTFMGACTAKIDSKLKEIAEDTGITKFRFYLSPDYNFRHDIAVTKPYKGNRAHYVKPEFLAECKQYLTDTYKAVTPPGFEADDAIATDMSMSRCGHCGIDKDIKQCVGWHYNWVTKEWFHTDYETAHLLLFRQVLMGDTSDNIPGLPGVGIKTAAKLLQDSHTAEADTLAYYHEVCAKKLPDVSVTDYFQEQYDLVKLSESVELTYKNTVTIKPSVGGFVPQEGGYVQKYRRL